MENRHQPDLEGEALKSQRFHLLEDIASELSSEEIVFPVCFELHQRIRTMLEDETLTLEKLAERISLEPLIDAKLLKLANSVAFRHEGPEICDIKTAIIRLGLRMVRNVALAVTMEQMLRAARIAEFESMARHLWEHSLRVACIAQVIARNKTRLNPDEAMLAGLVHDIGAFYMLYRAVQYEELRERPDTLIHLIMRWHESIGESVLFALNMPEAIVEGVRDHDQPREIPAVIRKLSDLIYVANAIAGGLSEWQLSEGDGSGTQSQAIMLDYLDLEAEIRRSIDEMLCVMA